MATVLSDRSELESMTTAQAFEKTQSGPKGLSSEDARRRLERDGPNEIAEKNVNILIKFLSYFWGPISWMIETAAILSAILGRWDDFGVIFALLLLNGGVGFWQEHKADSAIEALRKKLALKTRVQREGKWEQIEASGLVLGDIVRFRGGDTVPADIKLVAGGYLQIDESALTGESLPVEKHNGDGAFSSSLVRQGEMTGIVVATGMDTLIGKTAGLVSSVSTVSHFQKAVLKVGHYLIVLAMALVLGVILVALFRHESLLQTLQFSLVLVVAAVPVALPAVLSVTMAVGAMALAQKGAIVSRLVAIEEMAGVDVLCSDKTGTITKNEISIAEIAPVSGTNEEEILLYAALCSHKDTGDAIDEAVMTRLTDRNLTLDDFSVKEFSPFDPVRKRAESVVQSRLGDTFRVAKGAPQVIVDLLDSSRKNLVRESVTAIVDRMAFHGYRSLGVAKTGKDGAWEMAGVLGMLDPPQDDSAATLKTADKMGIHVKMVTGDHAAIAGEIASEVGMHGDVYNASSFEKMNDWNAHRLVEMTDIFAQVYPEHKYHIVELLQQNGHIVAMTGDGVNDAPALKKADVGFAVAGATDAAKAAAAIVLTDKGLSVIIDAIKQSRRIFQRMTSYTIYRIAETIRVLLFITFSIIVFKFYPITALMVVLLALLNDAPIMTIAYDNVLYSPFPEKWNMQKLIALASMLGLVGVFESFFMLYLGKEILHLSLDMLQSFIYLKLSVAGHLMLLNVRTRGPFWSVKPAPVLLLSLMGTQILATVMTVYGIVLPAMGWTPALIVWGEALLVFLLVDFLKIRMYRLLDTTGIRLHR